MSELMQVLHMLTMCYASVMGVPYNVTVEFEDLEEDLVAWADVDPDYLTSTITYDPEDMATYPDSVRRQTVVHELVHVLTWELVEVAEASDEELAWRLWEQFATRVEHWYMWPGVCNASTH